MGTEEFLNRLFKKHQEAVNFPATSTVCKLMTKLVLLLYPEQAKKKINNIDELQAKLNLVQIELKEILEIIPVSWCMSPEETASKFMLS